MLRETYANKTSSSTLQCRSSLTLILRQTAPPKTHYASGTKGTDENLKPLVIVKSDDDGGNWLNPFNLTSIPLKNRDAELDRLRAFADGPAPYQLWALIAPSGAGKTRLAAEWMLEYREERGWNVGFLDNPEPGIWTGWQPSANTLIVIDYIHNYGRAIKAILDRCENLSSDGALESLEVRILAIDHVFPERFTDILGYSPWNQVFESRIDLDARKEVFYEKDQLRLTEAQDRNSVLRQIVAHVGGKLPDGDRRLDAAMETLNKMEDAARHPLFAALIGDAIRNGRDDYRTWTRLQLVEYYLDSKNRLPWKQEKNPVGFWIGALVAAATIRDGADDSTLSDFLPEKFLKDGVEVVVSDHRNEIDGQITHITSSPTLGSRLNAFRPDIMGEFFVLLFLGRVRREKHNQAIFIEMLTTPDTDGDSRTPIAAWWEFFQRLARNLCNYDQNADRIVTFWANLDAFLDPKHFPGATDARYAISIVRADIAKELNRHGFRDRRAQFLKKIRVDELAAAVDGWMAPNALRTLYQCCEWSEPSGMTGSTLWDLTVTAALRFDRKFPHASMHLAMQDGYDKVIAALLEGGWAADIAQDGRDLASTLCAAALYGYANVVGTILTNDISPNVTAFHGVFPLLMAAQEGHAPVVDALLRKKDIDVNKTHEQSGTFPLLMAAQEGHAPVVDTLLWKKDIDVNKTHERSGTFPLLMAAQIGHAPVVDALLRKKDIDVNKTNEQSGNASRGRAGGPCPGCGRAALEKRHRRKQDHEQNGSFPLLMAAQTAMPLLWARCFGK